MARGQMKSLSEISAAVRGSAPASDLSLLIGGAFHLPAGALKARRDGDALVLCAPDKTVRFALEGMEQQVLGYCAARGHHGLRRVRWSAA